MCSYGWLKGANRDCGKELGKCSFNEWAMVSDSAVYAEPLVPSPKLNIGSPMPWGGLLEGHAIEGLVKSFHRISRAALRVCCVSCGTRGSWFESNVTVFRYFATTCCESCLKQRSLRWLTKSSDGEVLTPRATDNALRDAALRL